MKHATTTRRGLLSWLGMLGIGSTAPACHRLTPDASSFDLTNPGATVRSTALRLTANRPSPRAKALALYRFVRDEITFGFTGAFDQASPEETLAAGRGHCNPQASLFAALLNAVGVPARQHFVAIDNTIIAKLFPDYAQPPSVIDHSYVELKLDGRWIKLDGYIPDPPFFAAVKAKLDRHRQPLGWGAHRDGRIEWDGRSDCMAQLADEAMVIEDAGSYADPRQFYDSDRYRQALTPLTRLLFSQLLVPAANARIAELRASSTAAPRRQL